MIVSQALHLTVLALINVWPSLVENVWPSLVETL
jgi:hypothetical protein